MSDQSESKPSACLTCGAGLDATVHKVPTYQRVPGGYGHPFVAADTVAPEPPQPQTEDEGPSCHVCGTIMLAGFHCNSCGANTWPTLAKPPQVAAPPQTEQDRKIMEAYDKIQEHTRWKPHPTRPVLVWADIDIGIAPLVEYLNRDFAGVRTQASCQGTLGEGGPNPYPCYVMASWPKEREASLMAEFDIELLGENWGYIRKRAVPAVRPPESAKEADRCAICGWPLVNGDGLNPVGCVRGNCSQRPFPELFYDYDRACVEYGKTFNFKHGRPASAEPRQPVQGAEQLLPCPFCSGEYVRKELSPYNSKPKLEQLSDGSWRVSCYGCYVGTWKGLTKADAIETWNRRHAHASEQGAEQFWKDWSWGGGSTISIAITDPIKTLAREFAEAYHAHASEQERKELEQAISSRKHTQDWYAAHYGKVEDWARKILPEPWRTQYFNCVANGTYDSVKDVGEPYMTKVGMVTPSGYFRMDTAAEQLLRDQTERAESAEALIGELRDALLALLDNAEYMGGTTYELSGRYVEQVEAALAKVRAREEKK